MTAPAQSFLARWRVAIAAFVAQAVGPGLFAVYGLFVAPLAKAFDTSHASLALGMSMLLVVQALTGPVLGPILDRYSIRRIMLDGAALAATALFLASRSDRYWMLVACYAISTIGISLYAPLSAVVLVSNHYKARRGKALSVASVGSSLAGILFPLGTAQLLDLFDWRIALASLAWLVGGLALSAFTLLIPRRSDPERPAAPPRDVDAGPSTDTMTDSKQDPSPPTPPVSDWDFMRGRAFWIIGLTFSVLLGMAGFYAFSIAPHLRNVGLSVEDAALVMSVGAFVSLCSKLTFASIADRVRHRLIPITVGLICIQALAWFIVISAHTLPFFILAGALYSLTIGPFLVLGPYLNSIYFDETILGRVNGSQAPLVLPFALAAPPLAGLSFDSTGSYVPAFQGAITVLIVLGTLFLFLGPPRGKRAPLER